MVEKIGQESNCGTQVALLWAVAARNVLVHFSGFSPNQLVFGFNPAVLDVFHSNQPALEPVTSSQVVSENLRAMHSAREEFLK